MEIANLLLINLAVSATCFIALWLISIRLKDPSFVDAWWGLGIVVIAWTSYIITGRSGPRRLVLTALCTAWGLRLGAYLFWRWRSHGSDRRYVTMMAHAKKERGWGFATASLLLVFALQMPLQFIVALPVQLGQLGPDTGLGPLAIIGALLGMVGISFETIGDLQLVHFKSDPKNAGKVMHTGLWRYTRHPNYFGDACTWWGLLLIAAEAPFGLWALPGPVLLSFLLTRFSGVPTVEGRMRRTRPDYEAYVAQTSGFIPWWPKRG